ncbi:NAD(P)/FAD-dependent oxidoreductase [Alkalihalobacterium chitinilyticum]|uniref:NAD(P)-binding domain-containing protein n=1 Tax=Alkalihalobacterium chitinilyticum TaxID=2980103 RepID=A0ABT5V9G2_9BACI|nr:NAD(P)/FAD-dependent oxidoreductase [Alkalihalobacterium chitinilyticum]MDE5412098.1 NAD(P)-binding domain-containing protein [Alkalihalobacterium chitinilyticum]
MENRSHYDVIIVGAGPAGVGIGSIFMQMGLKNFVILERDYIGSSFKKWPEEMRLLTPSFPGHGFGLLDLNAVVPSTSPGYTFQTEHLSGEEYAEYLEAVAHHFKLPIKFGVNVTELDKVEEGFVLQTNDGTYNAQFVVWAGGEFQYPNKNVFPGAELCLHNSEVASWGEIKEDDVIVIGGYESAIDAAINLIHCGKQVTVLAKEEVWSDDHPDPSISLSPFTFDRLEEVMDCEDLILRGKSKVVKVEQADEGYTVFLENGEETFSSARPILGTGFKSSLSLIIEHFYYDENNIIELSDKDESTVSEGLFLVGPQVRHQDVIFCFIYKFRQRFAVVAKEIGEKLGMELNEELFEHYRKSNMLLDDLSCCDNSCQC